MADADDIEKKEEAKTEKDEQSPQTGTKISILTWIIMAVVIAVLAGSGFFLGRIFAGSSPTPASEPSQENSQAEKMQQDNSETDSQGTWYYDELESVVVNPDEPGATRFVRVGLILEISSALSRDKARELIEAQKPPLINWLNLYFKSLTLSEMENDRDMKRILSQICDSFNEILFPDAKPQIKRILIREFNIQ
jgi:flagellar basal body-associated protein FliL